MVFKDQCCFLLFDGIERSISELRKLLNRATSFATGFFKLKINRPVAPAMYSMPLEEMLFDAANPSSPRDTV